MTVETITFDRYYFQHGCGQPYERTPDWLAAFGALADQIKNRIAPKTALDAGCAMGFLVEALRDRGVEAFGVDISEYALQNVRGDIQPFCWRGSVADPLPRRYDLIICIEVLEHTPSAVAEQAIASFCDATDDVLFSSTPFDYREATHINVQPPEYWAYQFALHNFVRDVDFDASFVTPWAGRYRRMVDPWPRAVQNYERHLALVLKENNDLRGLANEMRTQLAAHELSAHELRAEMARLSASPSWRWLQHWRPQLFPLGSRRERWLTRLLKVWQRL